MFLHTVTTILRTTVFTDRATLILTTPGNGRVGIGTAIELIPTDTTSIATGTT